MGFATERPAAAETRASYGTTGESALPIDVCPQNEDGTAMSLPSNFPVGRRNRAIGIAALLTTGLLVLSKGTVEDALRTRSTHIEEGVVALESEEQSATTPSDGSRPHIVLVTLDDVGWNDLGSQSSDLAQFTPYMTALANDGVRLERYYGQSICTPARAALHSGKFVHRTGFSTQTMEVEVHAFSNYSVSVKNRLLAQRLRDDANYSTTFVGKWNIGHCSEQYMPWNRGFDYFLGYMAAGLNYVT